MISMKKANESIKYFVNIWGRIIRPYSVAFEWKLHDYSIVNK